MTATFTITLSSTEICDLFDRFDHIHLESLMATRDRIRGRDVIAAIRADAGEFVRLLGLSPNDALGGTLVNVLAADLMAREAKR